MIDYKAASDNIEVRNIDNMKGEGAGNKGLKSCSWEQRLKRGSREDRVKERK